MKQSIQERTLKKAGQAALGIVACSYLLLSCSADSKRIDLQKYKIEFDRKDAIYTNQEAYDFDWNTFGELRAKAPLEMQDGWHKLEIFENGNCENEPIELVDLAEVSNLNYTLSPAKNQTVYSVNIHYGNSAGAESRTCSFPVVFDRDAPELTGFDYPTTDHYIGKKEFLLKLKKGEDVGISGLSDEPYEVTLFGEPNCQTPLQTQTTSKLDIAFDGLTNNVFYSVGVVTTDRSGNRSPLSCSKHIEIDTNVPTLTLVDPLSAPGYTRTLTPNLVFGNDSTASYWCVTTDLDYSPLSISDACPGGGGSHNGWYTSPPPTITLAGGEGTKKYKGWIARSDGSLPTKRFAYYEVTYDITPPGAFSPIGVAGGESTIYDEWLNDLEDPILRWQPSTDAIDYTVTIIDSSNNVVCQYTDIPENPPEVLLEPALCPFIEGETYTVEVIAYDRARNPTLGVPELSFTVDLTPPSEFEILGVNGGADLNVDDWFGTTLPTVHYDDASGEDFYNIKLIDENGSPLCVNEREPEDSTFHNYALSSVGTCVPAISGNTYKVEVSAEDWANNITPATNTEFLVRADLTAPAVSVLSGPPALTPATSATINFTTSDELSGLESVRCRLNAEAFTDCSDTLSFSSLDQGDYVLEIRATDYVGNATLVQHSWSVDTENPVLAITSQPGPYTNQKNVSISFVATDAYGIDHYECRFENGEWETCTSPWTKTLDDAAYQLDLRAIDNVGHIHEQTAIWRVDTVMPELGDVTAAPITPGDDTTISVDFDPSDDQNIGQIECQLDDGPFVPCTPPYSEELLPAGEHTVTIRITDGAGNVVTDSVTWTIYEFEFSLTDPNSLPGYTRTLTPQLATNHDTAARYWCFTEDEDFSPSSADSPCPGGGGSELGWFTTVPATLALSPGEAPKTVYGWIAKADKVLARANRATVEITYDITPPAAFSITGVAGGTSTLYNEWLNSLAAPKLKWQSAAEAIKYDVIVTDSSANSICSYSDVLGASGLQDLAEEDCDFVEGELYNVSVKAYDRALNERMSAPAFSFVVDLTPPTAFDITGVDGGADLDVDLWFGTNLPRIHWTNPSGEALFRIAMSDESDNLVCAWDTENADTLSHDYQLVPARCSSITSGQSYKLKVLAEDYAANQRLATNDELVVRADHQAPTTVITSGPLSYTEDATANLTFAAGDSLSGLRQTNCKLNSQPWTNCTTSAVYTSLGEGYYTFTFSATDKVGNVSQKNHSWVIDRGSPTISLTSTPPSITNDNTPTVSYSAYDTYGISRYECRLNGASWSTCSTSWSQYVSDGYYTLEVRAFDNVGHVSNTVSTSWTVDTVAPYLTITSAPASTTYDQSSATVYFSASDNVSLAYSQCSFNGGYSGCSSSVSRSGLGAGSYTVTIIATDSAGNTSSRSTSWTNYTHSWYAGGWGACSAPQPQWQVSGWSGCSAGQPAWAYSGWGACSATCGAGTMSRSQWCPVVGGQHTRSVSCPTTYGQHARTVYCRRNNGQSVADYYCGGGKPTNTLACSRNDCPGGAPSATMACQRGGGGDCHSPQPTSTGCSRTCSWQSAGSCLGDFCQPQGSGCNRPSGPCSSPGLTCTQNGGQGDVLRLHYYQCTQY